MLYGVRLLVIVSAVFLAQAYGQSSVKGEAPLLGKDKETKSLDRLAESYVKLVLAVGEHDPAYVDAYFGPPSWKEESKTAQLSLADIRSRAVALLTEIHAHNVDQTNKTTRLRHTHLAKHVQALVARVEILGGQRLKFAEETKVLYDALAPPSNAAQVAAVRKQLEERLPGDGSLSKRYETFRQDFVIPVDRVDAVFKVALAECRERTLQHISLPSSESFHIEYVQGKPWDAYNSYQGNFQSLIQINTSFPIHIDYALFLACHEGYPGHHVYGILREQQLVRERGWVEFAITPLFSPQALIGEGSAQYGFQLAFPDAERLQFWRTKLFPLAGLNPARAEEYFQIQLFYDQVNKLSYVGNEAARRYLDGQLNAQATAEWLVTNSLMPMASAEQWVHFIEQFRSYVINYNLGQDLVRRFVERQAGSATSAARRWGVFQDLFTSPRLPSDLTAADDR